VTRWAPFLCAAIAALPLEARSEEGALAPCCAPAEPAQADPQGYTPPVGLEPALSIHGYVDVGFAKAQGNGTSFRDGDATVPADYGADPFASAVNSRGEVASTDSGGRVTNGFLPRSAGIGGKASFLVNTVDLDLRYQPQRLPLLVFARLQFLPRFGPAGDATRVVIEQAFGRIAPFDAEELSIALGKFDPVFGIEYLDNQANLRTGVTPSLIARYTTGTPLGVKLFYRRHLPSLWSALSINVAATNSSPFVESLQTPDASLTGVPFGAARAGYELDLPRVQVKLGASGMFGARNDQRSPEVQQRGWGADLRLYALGLSAASEFVWVREDRGIAAEKLTGLSPQPFASGFEVHGLWAQLAYGLALPGATFRALTPYAAYSWRHAAFEGFPALAVERFTFGLRLDVWDSLIAKVEYLVNRELAGAPNVPNDVFTSSVVYSW
jgi:hypothetical protein